MKTKYSEYNIKIYETDLFTSSEQIKEHKYSIDKYD